MFYWITLTFSLLCNFSFICATFIKFKRKFFLSNGTFSFIFRQIQFIKYGRKIFLSKECVFPMFANCVHVKNIVPQNLFIFWKKILKTLKCSSGHVECSIDNTSENFSPKVWKIFVQIPKIIEIYEAFKNVFSSRCSSGHEQCNFEHPVGIFSPKVPKFSAKFQKIIESLYIFKKKSWKRSSGHIECSFDSTTENFLGVFLKSWVRLKKIRFFSKSVKDAIGSRRRVLWFHFLKKSFPL